MESVERYYELDSGGDKLRVQAENRLLEYVKSQKVDKLVEIGCGNGHLLRKFLEIETLGLDIDEDMKNLGTLQGSDIILGDIRERSTLDKLFEFNPDTVIANYVFMMLKSSEMEIAYKNIFEMLPVGGQFVTTITNPLEYGRRVFPGHRMIFENGDFDYNKMDLPFRVELENEEGEYEDFGIIDYHKPIDFYSQVLRDAGFGFIELEEIRGDIGFPFAIMCKAKK